MKKFSKALAALLIATLLVSVFAVMSSAVTTTGSARLNVTSDPYNFYNDFSEAKTGGTFGGGTLQNDSTHIKGVKMDYKGGYFRAYHNPTVAPASTSFAVAAWTMTKWAKSAAGYKGTDLLASSYTILDLEFGTDRYYYTYDDNGTVKYATTTSLDNVTVDIIESGLAIVPGTSLSFYLQAHELSQPTNYDRRKYDDFLWFVQDDNGVWYASANTAYDSSDIKLSNEINVTDHVSVVLDSTTDLGAVISHVYVNGEYLWSNTLPYKTTCDVLAFRGAGVKIPGTEKGNDRYSYMIDNIALNWYRTDVELDSSNVTTAWSPYSSGDGVYGVDDLIADVNNGVYNPIYMCEDVLYTGEYYSPNGGITVDDTFSSIPGMFDDVLMNVKNESVITADVDIADFNVPEDVEEFTLKYNADKVNIDFAADFNDRYVMIPQGDGETYKVRTIQEQDWFSFNYALDGAIIKSNPFLLAKSPMANISFMKFDLASLKLSSGVATSWTFDVDGFYENAPNINLYEEEAIRALTLNEVQLINEEFGGKLVANASSEGIELSDVDLSGYAYLAGQVIDGVLYVLTDSMGGFEQYKDIATLEAESANWSADVKCYKLEGGAATEYEWNTGAEGGFIPVALWHGNAINDVVSPLQFNNAPQLMTVEDNFVIVK
ncbi:MAG: hypothetical protein E7612_00885 [Ruminococcaceae bacterium]|nr:hypothetical protein [Oscillospiraceae bacterium]